MCPPVGGGDRFAQHLGLLRAAVLRCIDPDDPEPAVLARQAQVDQDAVVFVVVQLFVSFLISMSLFTNMPFAFEIAEHFCQQPLAFLYDQDLHGNLVLPNEP